MPEENNRFESLMNKIRQLPDSQRQRPRAYLDQDSLWQERDQELKEIYANGSHRIRDFERGMPSETSTVKILRKRLAAIISGRYERYHSPAKVRHPRASNWDVPEAESSFWNDLANSLNETGSCVPGVEMLGLTLTRHPKELPRFDIKLDCSIDSELRLFHWEYNPDRKELYYSQIGRSDRLDEGVHVKPTVEVKTNK